MTARTPEQHEARVTAEDEPAGSRRARRRLTFGVAGDLAGMPATLSPWQRAYEAWRTAGLSWGHGAPPRERPAAPPTDAPDDAARSKPHPEDVHVAGSPKPVPPPAPTRPEKTGAKKARPEKARPEKARPEKARPEKARPEKAGSRRAASRSAVVVGLVVVAGGVLVGVTRGGGESVEPDVPAVPGAVAADASFAPDPAAATDGLVQELTAVTSTGSTVVAAGTEGPGVPGRERARFLLSTDAGRTWSVAGVRAADGSVPTLGDVPRHVAGGAGRWAAFGGSAGGSGPVAWTSTNATTWTKRRLGTGFAPTDRVNDLTHKGSGFVAVGDSSGRAVVWTSPDGETWQRVEGLNGVTSLDRVAAHGDVLVAHGTHARRVTVRKGRKKVARTVLGEGLWRSTDAGRTWTPVTVPQAQRSYGPTKGLTVGPGGFATVREARQVVRRKKKRKISQYGVLFTSADGLRWQAASRFGGSGIERFDGTRDGLAVVVRGARGARAVLRSDDGRAWRPGGTVPAAVGTSGLTVSAGTLLISGRQGVDAYLSGVDLRTVPGAVRPDRSIRSLAGGPGRVVAVGATNGGAAIWSAPDGRAWTRARFPATPGWLSDVVRGDRGWLAVGRTSGAAPGPLAMTSQDGAVWRRSPFPGGPPPVAVAAGPAGHVAVGAGSAWLSTDLAAWRRSVLDGAPADVTATVRGYVAVGGRGTAPAVWTSQNGTAWTPAKLPPGLAPAPLTEVAAHGDVLVAIGADSTALVSGDGGMTWAPRSLGANVAATAVTATTSGFVVTASASGQDGAVLASADGVTWRRVRVPGLSGPGDQRLTEVTTLGPAVVATGVVDDTRAEVPLLWYAPVPK
ncbi:hypothetical protein D0T12_16220 [Actinomadura spongiicola]|uniref:Uncharacterized protein n=1 Tax=Actinomadura spongiicola TaxID=2303421 RepID=A0A372GI42_9ACTN|nr:hypothetical protein [Actinomadura spongiicola]RFS85027.1 hypothetical protein D0T12_16220 [Actinomadura spongiicola]